jgi:phosphinothricin acetyltransferase
MQESSKPAQNGNGMEIREATIEDLPAITSIYNYEVVNGTSTFDTEPVTVDQQRAWLQRHSIPRHPVIVADTGTTILGWASLSPWSDRRAYTRAAEVSVYVHPDHRGRRVGQSLLEGLIDRARDAGLGVLLARICTEGEASLRLHKKMGFGNIGTMQQVGEKFGRLLDVAILDLHF